MIMNVICTLWGNAETSRINFTLTTSELCGWHGPCHFIWPVSGLSNPNLDPSSSDIFANATCAASSSGISNSACAEESTVGLKYTDLAQFLGFLNPKGPGVEHKASDTSLAAFTSFRLTWDGAGQTSHSQPWSGRAWTSVETTWWKIWLLWHRSRRGYVDWNRHSGTIKLKPATGAKFRSSLVVYWWDLTYGCRTRDWLASWLTWQINITRQTSQLHMQRPGLLYDTFH